mmetsp:Transcript_20266/g.58163  ORF Transcript_20266/g.58163 Transcript_20266/m.58163 type:complete len:700 (-) Transcript_20266:101-2200(-)
MPAAEVGNASSVGCSARRTSQHQQNSGEPSGDNDCRRRPASAASGTAGAGTATSNARVSFLEDARSSGIGDQSRHRYMYSDDDAAAAVAVAAAAAAAATGTGERRRSSHISAGEGIWLVRHHGSLRREEERRRSSGRPGTGAGTNFRKRVSQFGHTVLLQTTGHDRHELDIDHHPLGGDESSTHQDNASSESHATATGLSSKASMHISAQAEEEAFLERIVTTMSSAQGAVHFSTVSVQYHATVLGVNPFCTSGPPISLGWYQDPSLADNNIPIDEYERYFHSTAPKSEWDLALGRAERERRLLDAGYSRDKIAAAIRETNRVKDQRRQTVLTLGTAGAQEFAESIARTTKKTLLLRKGSDHLYQEWKASSRGMVQAIDPVQSNLKGVKHKPKPTRPRKKSLKLTSKQTSTVPVPMPAMRPFKELVPKMSILKDSEMHERQRRSQLINGVGSRPELMQYPTGRASPPVPVIQSPDKAGSDRKAATRSKLALLSAKLSRKKLVDNASNVGSAQETEAKESSTTNPPSLREGYANMKKDNPAFGITYSRLSVRVLPPELKGDLSAEEDDGRTNDGLSRISKKGGRNEVIPPPPLAQPIILSASSTAPEDVPFASIEAIAALSPAYEAGLRKGDKLIRFGGITHRNHDNLTAVAELGQVSFTKERKISVEFESHKDGTRKTTTVRPRKWPGRGPLGFLLKLS